MSLKVLCSIFLVYSVLVPTLSFKIQDAKTTILANLQSAHYDHVTQALDKADYLANQLYFVDDDLKTNAQTYLQALADERLQALRPLKEICYEIEACLACFDSEARISRIASNTTATLVKYLEDQKAQYNKSVSEIQENTIKSALLSTEVYEKYKDSNNFGNDATAYYERIRKALVYETDLFNRTVSATISQLINYHTDATIEATKGIEDLFNTILECADQALNNLQ